MGSPLGPTQRLVLLALGRDPEGWGLPTGADVADIIDRIAVEADPELAEAVAERPCTTAAAASALITLERRGLVEAVGRSFSHARTWAITEAGEAALERQPCGTRTRRAESDRG